MTFRKLLGLKANNLAPINTPFPVVNNQYQPGTSLLISHYRQNADGQDPVRDVMGPVTSFMHSFVMPVVQNLMVINWSVYYNLITLYISMLAFFGFVSCNCLWQHTHANDLVDQNVVVVCHLIFMFESRQKL